MDQLERLKQADKLFEALFDLYDSRIGDWRADPELRDTPHRMSEVWEELTQGYEPLKESLRSFPTTYSGIIAKADVPFATLCPHHGLPVMGKSLIGYVPARKRPVKLGLSKMTRLVTHCAGRMIAQEELTDLIADQLMEVTRARGCIVGLRAYHACEGIRGVRTPSVTCTQALRGDFLKDTALRTECYDLTGWKVRE